MIKFQDAQSDPAIREQVTDIFRRQQRALAEVHQAYLEAFAKVNAVAQQAYDTLNVEGLNADSAYILTPQAKMFTCHNLGGVFHTWYVEKPDPA